MNRFERDGGPVQPVDTELSRLHGLGEAGIAMEMAPGLFSPGPGSLTFDGEIPRPSKMFEVFKDEPTSAADPEVLGVLVEVFGGPTEEVLRHPAIQKARQDGDSWSGSVQIGTLVFDFRHEPLAPPR